MEQISFKLDSFEGPLDLLLMLIKKNKVNIYDIPIAQILEQYLEVIAQMESLDLEMSSEFLVMAATLLKIKSRMLLPQEETEEEEQEDCRREEHEGCREVLATALGVVEAAHDNERHDEVYCKL
jgi:segregation and condensation protein A